MADRHIMVTEATLPHGWLAQCPNCSRRIFIYQNGEAEVIDGGNFSALHSWSSTTELSIGASVKVSDG